MRRTLIGALMGAAAGLLAACGGAGDEAPSTESPAVPASGPSGDPAATSATETEEASAPFADLPEPYASADYDRGRRIFLQCQSCHTLEEGGPSVLGPNLYGLFDREVGTKPGFDYSPALQEADFTWTPEQLEQWLANPRAFLPGNRMSFAGVRRPDDRTAVIAYVMAGTGYEGSSD